MQSQQDIWNNKKLIKVLRENGVVVMPTDTIYGIVCRAQAESAVNRIYAVRKRNRKKPCIILIGDIAELEKFSVVLSGEQKNKLKEYWLGSPSPLPSPEGRGGNADGVDRTLPTSIVLDCPDEKFSYLHRGTKTLAFRLPASQGLRDLLLKVGSLIAPSANLENFPPNDNIHDAKKHFGDSVDLYVDGGVLTGKPSRLIKLRKDGSINVLRL